MIDASQQLEIYGYCALFALTVGGIIIYAMTKGSARNG